MTVRHKADPQPDETVRRFLADVSEVGHAFPPVELPSGLIEKLAASPSRSVGPWRLTLGVAAALIVVIVGWAAVGAVRTYRDFKRGETLLAQGRHDDVAKVWRNIALSSQSRFVLGRRSQVEMLDFLALTALDRREIQDALKFADSAQVLLQAARIDDRTMLRDHYRLATLILGDKRADRSRAQVEEAFARFHDAEKGIAVKHPGRVVIYSCMNPEFDDALERALRDEEHIDVEIVSFEGASSLLGDLVKPDGSGVPDMLLGGDIAFHEKLRTRDALANIEDVSAQRSDQPSSPYWRAWYRGYIGLIVRSGIGRVGDSQEGWELLQQAPDTFRIAIPDPADTGGGFVFMATQLERLGRTEGLQWMEKLIRPNVTFTRPSIEAVHMVGNDDADMAVAWIHDALRVRDAFPGYKYEVLVPDTIGSEIGGVSALKDTRHLQLVKRIVTFLGEPRAAELNCEFGYRTPLEGDRPCLIGAEDYLHGKTVLPVDRKSWVVNKANWERAWRQMLAAHRPQAVASFHDHSPASTQAVTQRKSRLPSPTSTRSQEQRPAAVTPS